MRNRKPIPEALLNYLEPVKPFINGEPIEKDELIRRCERNVDEPVVNFLHRFSFIEISKMENGELMIL